MIINVVFTALALLFITIIAWNSREALAPLASTINVNMLVIATTVWVVAQLLPPVFTWIQFHHWPVNSSYQRLLWIHLNRLPSKYLPGGIWNSLSRSGDYLLGGLPGRVTASYLTLEMAVSALISLWVGSAILLSTMVSSDVAVIVFLMSSLVGILALAMLGRFSFWIHQVPNYRFRGSRLVLGSLAIGFFWLMAGASFYLYFSAFNYTDTAIAKTNIVGAYIFSWGIGFVTLIAPQGIGVSEIVASKLISVEVDFSELITVIAGFRLVTATGDLAAWSLGKVANLAGLSCVRQ